MNEQATEEEREERSILKGGGGGHDAGFWKNITVITCIDIKKYGGITSMGSQTCK